MKSKDNRNVYTTLYQAVAITAVGLATSSRCLVEAYGIPSTMPTNSLMSNPNSLVKVRSNISSRSRRSCISMYRQGDAPSSPTPEMVRGHMSSGETKSNVSYSPFVDLVDGGGSYSAQSILQDNTPFSPMAKDTMIGGGLSHGLLSPFTVSFIADVCPEESLDSQSKTLQSFLNTYRSAGPMACLHFLSDPHVLPILTKAMREAYHHASIN